MVEQKDLISLTAACEWQKKQFFVGVAKTVIASKDYTAANATMSQLPLEVIYWNIYETFGKYREFAH